MIKNYIYVAVGLALITLFSWLTMSLISAKNEIIRLKTSNSELIYSIKSQNKEIEKLKFDTKKYQKDFENKKKELEKKYSSLGNTDASCESQLEKLQNLLEIWNKN